MASSLLCAPTEGGRVAPAPLCTPAQGQGTASSPLCTPARGGGMGSPPACTPAQSGGMSSPPLCLLAQGRGTTSGPIVVHTREGQLSLCPLLVRTGVGKTSLSLCWCAQRCTSRPSALRGCMQEGRETASPHQHMVGGGSDFPPLCPPGHGRGRFHSPLCTPAKDVPTATRCSSGWMGRFPTSLHTCIGLRTIPPPHPHPDGFPTPVHGSARRVDRFPTIVRTLGGGGLPTPRIHTCVASLVTGCPEAHGAAGGRGSVQCMCN